MGAENLLGEPLTNLSTARLAAVFQRIQRVVDQTALLDRSLSTSASAITHEMNLLSDALQVLARELAQMECVIEKILRAEASVLETAMADRISASVTQALDVRMNQICLKLQRVEDRIKALPEALVPWWRKLWNAISTR